PTSQPLRCAYISIVMAVHDARLAASRSCGHGPASSPPWSGGSSTVRSCWPILTVCRSVPAREEVAFMAIRSCQRVEEKSCRHLGKEVRRLGRHVDARRGDLLNLLDRAGSQEER